MKIKRRVVSLLMAIIILFTGPHAAHISASEMIVQTANNLEKNHYNKLHFYFTEDYNVIENLEELQAAVGLLKEGNDGSMLSLCDASDNCEQTSPIEVVVEFESDFMQTEQYLRFLDNREKCEDMNAVHRMREEFNSFSKEYHTAIVVYQYGAMDENQSRDYLALTYH